MIFTRHYKVRIQLPFDVLGESMPEPDGLVCTAEQGRRDPHPNRAVVVIDSIDDLEAEAANALFIERGFDA